MKTTRLFALEARRRSSLSVTNSESGLRRRNMKADSLFGLNPFSIPKDVAHAGKRLPSLLQRFPHLLPDPFVGEGQSLAGDDQLAVKPGRAVIADLAVEVLDRQDLDADVGAVPSEIVGLTSLGEIGGDAPVIAVNPLG